ncbi:Uncharacterised protein [Yersinia frederiksenii]|nr:Uncharacterised protein [Yersinia frederiksenii]
MNEALREIEENLELLGINGDDSLGKEATNWWKAHDAKTVQTIASKKWNKKNTE